MDFMRTGHKQVMTSRVTKGGERIDEGEGFGGRRCAKRQRGGEEIGVQLVASTLKGGDGEEGQVRARREDEGEKREGVLGCMWSLKEGDGDCGEMIFGGGRVLFGRKWAAQVRGNSVVVWSTRSHTFSLMVGGVSRSYGGQEGKREEAGCGGGFRKWGK
ncbi:hypothetical protein HAX54_040976 [Datura stramonium]|uniref:Uncharacterized protein n=1 Tax=Datura stramonium TaxID=4076 RepID=A0ABS8VPQ3_DATST|nr:hypothetical protein [Datura stramonium]